MKNQRDEAYRLYQISHALAEDSPVIRERALYHRVLIELEVKDYERSEKHLEQLSPILNRFTGLNIIFGMPWFFMKKIWIRSAL